MNGCSPSFTRGPRGPRTRRFSVLLRVTTWELLSKPAQGCTPGTYLQIPGLVRRQPNLPSLHEGPLEPSAVTEIGGAGSSLPLSGALAGTGRRGPLSVASAFLVRPAQSAGLLQVKADLLQSGLAGCFHPVTKPRWGPGARDWPKFNLLVQQPRHVPLALSSESAHCVALSSGKCHGYWVFPSPSLPAPGSLLE